MILTVVSIGWVTWIWLNWVKSQFYSDMVRGREEGRGKNIFFIYGSDVILRMIPNPRSKIKQSQERTCSTMWLIFGKQKQCNLCKTNEFLHYLVFYNVRNNIPFVDISRDRRERRDAYIKSNLQWDLKKKKKKKKLVREWYIFIIS